MNFWGLLIFSAVTILLCRVLPFLFANHPILSNKEGGLYRFLTYSTQAMLGGIVYATVYDSQNITQLFTHFSTLEWLKVALLIFVFIATIKTNRLLSVFLLSFVIFVVCVMWIL